MQKIRVVESSHAILFEDDVNELLKSGYRILSTNCGRIGKEDDRIESFYSAVLIINNNDLEEK